LFGAETIAMRERKVRASIEIGKDLGRIKP
jgi:hypothetical protein